MIKLLNPKNLSQQLQSNQDLIAITGSNREAIAAGTIPEITPTLTETPMPSATLLAVRTKSSDPRLTKDRRYTRKIPITPPNKLRKIASNRNWKRMK